MHRASPDPLDALGAIYAAAAQPDQWTSALTDLCDRLDAFDITLIYWRKPTSEVSLLVSAGRFSEEAVGLYAAHYGRLDPRIDITTRLPPGEPVLFDRLIDQDTIRHSEFYNDFLMPQGGRWAMGGVLLDTDDLRATIGFHRGPRHDPFQDRDRAAMTGLFPHFARAARLHSRFAALEDALSLSTRAVDQLAFGVIVCDEIGRIGFMNSQAEAMAAGDNGLLVHANVLSMAMPDKAAHLRQLLHDAIYRRIGGEMTVERPAGRALVIRVAPLAADAPLADRRQPSTVVLLNDPDHPHRLLQEALAALYRLTPREARLAEALVASGSIESAAGQLGLTRESARTYLKRILAKTGTSRQTELVALLLRSLGPAA